MNTHQKPDITELTELDEFFPPASAKKRPTKVRAVDMQPGESYEDAVRRQDERIAKIKAANAARTTGKQ